VQALTKQVTDTVSLQAEIEAQQATINSLQQDVAQLEQLNSSKDTMLEDLQAGNVRLREKLQDAEALRKQADRASKVRGGPGTER
jgi:predicted nuclease with TOPRIM domain